MHTTNIKIIKNNKINIMIPDNDIGHGTIHRIDVRLKSNHVQ